MHSTGERFHEAQRKYKELLESDFPGFDVDEYIRERVQESEPSSGEEDKSGTRVKLGRKAFIALDRSGDGKLDLADVNLAAKGAGNAMVSAVKGAQGSLKQLDFTDAAPKGRIFGATAKIGKAAVGVQGFQNRKIAKAVTEICTEYYDAAAEVTEERRGRLNYAIVDFGEYRLKVLHQVVSRFLDYLTQLERKNAAKEYEILIGAEISTEKLAEFERLDMAVSEALRTTALTGAFGVAAVMGTPALVTGTVAAMATASTGTAISSLSGIAATNATMAWLGGGAVAAGGGGVAAGTATLFAITAATTSVTALLAAGSLISVHYSRKLTQARDFEKEVGVVVASLETAWIIMDGLAQRTAELRDVTEELKWRTIKELDRLEPLISDFDVTNPDHVAVFNKCAVLVKTTTELAQTPLLDEEGNLSSDGLKISSKVRSVLNSEV